MTNDIHNPVQYLSYLTGLIQVMKKKRNIVFKFIAKW